MKKTLYLACFLAIVSALAGGLLAAVNEVTAAKINANALAEVMGSLEKDVYKRQVKFIGFRAAELAVKNEAADQTQAQADQNAADRLVPPGRVLLWLRPQLR